MTHWILFAAPLLVASLVLVFGFVGCGLNDRGEQAGETPETPETPKTYKEVVGDTKGLVSYWRLGEKDGPTATDSADGNDGEYTGGCALGQPGLVVGDTDFATGFDGSSAYVKVAHNPNLNPPAFTVEALVTVTSGGSTARTVVASTDAGGDPDRFGYILNVSETNVWNAWVGTAAGWTQLLGPSVTDGPHYLAMTYDGTTLKLYVDPTQETTHTATTAYLPNAANELRIGAGTSETTPQFFFAGVIDEVAIYDTWLDVETIVAHSTLALTGSAP